MFTNDSYYISPHFSPNNNRSTLSPFDPSSPSSDPSGADENNNNHLDDLGRSRPSSVVSDYPSPAIPSSPQPTFDPSPRLTVNVVKDCPYAEVEYCTSSPNLNPKVLCLSMNLDTLFDSLCQMTNRFDKSMNSYQP